MPNAHPRRPSAATTSGRPSTFVNPYARLTAAILAEAETAGPWTPPWHGAGPLPRNALNGRPYSGLNVLTLWAAAQRAGFVDPRWATYRQWAALGAQVRQGERGTAILFYRDRAAEEGDSPDCEPAGAEAPRRFVARTSTVFNAAQVDGAPDRTGTTALPISEPILTIDAFVAAAGARVMVGGPRACYVPVADTIRIPPTSTFRTAEAYAGTLAHELVHWTGTPHRLARDLTGRFGSHAYAVEELTAELGAAFVLADLGLARVPHPEHAAYVRAWLPLLRAEPRALALAASQAGRAAAYLAGLQSDTGTGDTDASAADLSPSSTEPATSVAVRCAA